MHTTAWGGGGGIRWISRTTLFFGSLDHRWRLVTIPSSDLCPLVLREGGVVKAKTERQGAQRVPVENRCLPRELVAAVFPQLPQGPQAVQAHLDAAHAREEQ